MIDTARRRIVYVHCVAPNRIVGPGGTANAYNILTHSEDRQGASLRSVLPEGYLTTTLEVKETGTLFHQAKAVENDPDDRACRTKLCADPVGDVEKLFTMWDEWGWHRVTCYGDLKARSRSTRRPAGCRSSRRPEAQPQCLLFGQISRRGQRGRRQTRTGRFSHCRAASRSSSTGQGHRVIGVSGGTPQVGRGHHPRRCQGLQGATLAASPARPGTGGPTVC